MADPRSRPHSRNRIRRAAVCLLRRRPLSRRSNELFFQASGSTLLEQELPRNANVTPQNRRHGTRGGTVGSAVRRLTIIARVTCHASFHERFGCVCRIGIQIGVDRYQIPTPHHDVSVSDVALQKATLSDAWRGRSRYVLLSSPQIAPTRTRQAQRYQRLRCLTWHVGHSDRGDDGR
jgi:hypothetical protein